MSPSRNFIEFVKPKKEIITSLKVNYFTGPSLLFIIMDDSGDAKSRELTKKEVKELNEFLMEWLDYINKIEGQNMKTEKEVQEHIKVLIEYNSEDESQDASKIFRLGQINALKWILGE